MHMPVFLVSTTLLAIGALGMAVRAKSQKKPIMVWLFSAILVADLAGTGLVLVGSYLR